MVEGELERERIIQEVFAPGNLVWGGRLDEAQFHDLATRGILPAIYHGGRMPIRPRAVCLSMLSTIQMDRSPLAAYIGAVHEGPKRSEERILQRDEPLHLGLLVSRERIITSFGNRVEAIGDHFHNEMFSDWYRIDKDWKKVFGIPIQDPEPYEEDPWSDEVVIRFGDTKEKNVTGVLPDMWKGIVVSHDYNEQLKRWMQKEQMPVLPIFSPEGEIL